MNTAWGYSLVADIQQTSNTESAKNSQMLPRFFIIQVAGLMYSLHRDHSLNVRFRKL